LDEEGEMKGWRNKKNLLPKFGEKGNKSNQTSSFKKVSALRKRK
jgi:hypothetical protein